MVFFQSNPHRDAHDDLVMPALSHFQAFFFNAARISAAPLIDALRPLRLSGTLRSTIHIANDYKVLAGLQQYPWQETGGKVPLHADVMLQLRRRLKFGAWSASGGLYGTRGQVAEARRMMRQALKGKVERLQFLDDRMLGLASRFAKPYQFLTGWYLRRTLELVRPVYGLLKGIPTDTPWRVATGARKPASFPNEPDRDRCGLLWCAPVAPIEGEHTWMVHLAREVLLGMGLNRVFANSDHSVNRVWFHL
jgi:4-cresol dehydrogenase (hydroxylating)